MSVTKSIRDLLYDMIMRINGDSLGGNKSGKIFKRKHSLLDLTLITNILSFVSLSILRKIDSQFKIIDFKIGQRFRQL